MRRLVLALAPLGLFVLPAAYLVGGRPAAEEPVAVLGRYLEAAYARDYRSAYRLVSIQDQKLKSEREYVRERGAFSGFTLELARTLARAIELTPVEVTREGERARIRVRLSLPDASRLGPLMLDWNEEKLNRLPPHRQREILAQVARLKASGELPRIEGEQSFELVREPGGWRLFHNWAAGVRVAFSVRLPEKAPFRVEAGAAEVLAVPGELFHVTFRLKNPGPGEVWGRVSHRIEPEELADYLELIDCGLLLPVRLLPGEEEEYLSTYALRAPPDGIKSIAVAYEFVALPKAPP
jgi:hypothetical protein